MEENKHTQKTEIHKDNISSVDFSISSEKMERIVNEAKEEQDRRKIRIAIREDIKNKIDFEESLMELFRRFDPRLIKEALIEEGGVTETKKLIFEELRKLEQKQSDPITIPLRIIEDPLTPQNLALALTSLTELATELWLIGKRRYADLVEYTQTHDVRFSNEVGVTIDWITYNSPVDIGLQLAQIVPGLADAFMTIVNGLTLRKAQLEKLELENQAMAQQIEEAKQKADNEQKVTELNIKMIEVDLALRQWETYNKIYAGTDILTGITKMVLIEDDSTKSMLKQAVMTTVLQLGNAKGLELVMQTSKSEEQTK